MTQQTSKGITLNDGMKPWEWWLMGIIPLYFIIYSVLVTLRMPGIYILFNISMILCSGFAIYLSTKKQTALPRIVLILFAVSQLSSFVNINHLPGGYALGSMELLGELLFIFLVLRSAFQNKRIDLGILGLTFLSSLVLVFFTIPFIIKIPVLIEAVILAYILVFRKTIPKILLYPLIYLFIMDLAEVLSMPLVAIAMNFSEEIQMLW